MKKRILMLLLSIIILTGCGNADSDFRPAASPTLAHQNIETEMSSPTKISTPTPKPTLEVINDLPPTPTPYVMYTTTALNVRSGPGTDYEILTSLKQDTAVSIISEEGNWSKIQYNDNFAYVSTKYLTSKTDTVSPDNDVTDNEDEKYSETSPTPKATQTPTPEPTQQTPSKAPDPDKDSGKTNFDTYDNEEQQNTTASYVLNTSSKKIHLPSCRTVKKIAPKNYSTSDLSIPELEKKGYSRCGICLK